jgi:hypothetical protein
MGWEPRGANKYYYRKEREGSRVKSVYVGRGEIAQIISQIQSTSPLMERLARSVKTSEAKRLEKENAALEQATDLVRLITQAALLSAGFHSHKRQWRKRRYVARD